MTVTDLDNERQQPVETSVPSFAKESVLLGMSETKTFNLAECFRDGYCVSAVTSV